MAAEYLTNKKIIDCIRTSQVPLDKLVVVGGAALKLFGIKETTDIDVVVPSSVLMNRALDKHTYGGGMHSPIDGQKVTENGVEYRILDWKDYYTANSTGTLTFIPAPDDSLYSVTYEELHNEALNIDGILVSPPERILEWKQAINRDKDIPDITAIQSFLSTIS